MQNCIRFNYIYLINWQLSAERLMELELHSVLPFVFTEHEASAIQLLHLSFIHCDHAEQRVCSGNVFARC